MTKLALAVALGCWSGCAVDGDAGHCPRVELEAHGRTKIPASAFCVASGDAVFSDGAWSTESDVVQFHATVHSSATLTASAVRLWFVDSPSRGGYTVLLRAIPDAEEFAYGFVNTDAQGTTDRHLDASFRLPHAVADAVVIVQVTTNAPFNARLLGVDITTD